MQIIIDTNFFITCIKQKIDLFSELEELYGKGGFEIVVPSQVLNELEMLKDNKKMTIKEKESAKLAIFLIDKNEADIVDMPEKSADLAIIAYANNNNAIVATLDRKLKSQIKNKKTKFLIIRNQKRLVED
jgi:rRNA-processing protein FCF1